MYEIAKREYAECGIDTEDAIAKLKDIPVSIHYNLSDGGLSKKIDESLFICAFCIVLFDKISPLWTNL